MNVYELIERATEEVVTRINSGAERVFGEFETTHKVTGAFTTMLPSGYSVPVRVLRLRVMGKRKRWPFPFGEFPVRFETDFVFVGRADEQPLFACGHCKTVVDGYTHPDGNVSAALAAASADLLAHQIRCAHVTIGAKA